MARALLSFFRENPASAKLAYVKLRKRPSGDEREEFEIFVIHSYRRRTVVTLCLAAATIEIFQGGCGSLTHIFGTDRNAIR